MSLSRQEQIQQQVAAAAAPLVVRNKRGRKVDETLPKSHQREVQRQFRARRTSHLLELERRVSILERENMILRHYAGFQPSNRYLLGRGPTGCDTTKPLLADESDPEVCLVRIEGWTGPTLQSPVTSSGHEAQWPLTPPTATSLHARQEYALDAHAEHPYATYDPKSAEKLVFEPHVPGFDRPPKIEHQPHSVPSYDTSAPAHFDAVQPPYDAVPSRFDPSAPEAKREAFTTQLPTVPPLSSLLSSANTRSVYDARAAPFSVAAPSQPPAPSHDSTGVPSTPYASAGPVSSGLTGSYPWSSGNSDLYVSHGRSLSSVNLPTSGAGAAAEGAHRHHAYQRPSVTTGYAYGPTSLNSFTPAPAAQGQHPSFQPVDAPTDGFST